MNYIAFYLFIGFLAYYPMGKALGVPFKEAKWHELLLASTVWAVIWLPHMLHAIVMLQMEILNRKGKE